MTEPTNSKVPKIRFKGFEGEWDEKPIGEILSERKRPIILKDHQRYELITVKRRNAGVVSRGSLLGREILVKNYSQLEAGDFVISKRQVIHGATGIIPSNLNGAIVSNEYLIAAGNNRISTEFLTLLATLPDMRKKFFLSSYGVDIEKMVFEVEDWKKRVATIPSVTEQTQIGGYFREMDRLIGLQQRKHDKLVTLKKAMLQKMFPQPGTTTPEIRFKDFEGEWKVQTLDQLADRYDNLRIPISASNRIPGKTPYYGANGIQGYVQGHTHAGEYILVAEDGANDLKNYPVQFVSGKVWVNNHAHVLQAKDGLAVTRFLKYAFTQINVEIFLVGGGRSKLNAETMMEMQLCAPEEIEEQQKIGHYFRTLDELISKHAIQLEKLKQLKTACLERMFV